MEAAKMVYELRQANGQHGDASSDWKQAEVSSSGVEAVEGKGREGGEGQGRRQKSCQWNVRQGEAQAVSW